MGGLSTIATVRERPATTVRCSDSLGADDRAEPRTIEASRDPVDEDDGSGPCVVCGQRTLEIVRPMGAIARTSVNSWDATDPEFSRALKFFDVETPPALVLARGLKGRGQRLLDPQSVCAITIVDPKMLGDRERLASAVNSAHEVLMRGDATEIARYIRNQDRDSLLALITAVAERLRDEILKLKPELQLPGDVSLQLG